MANWSNRVAQNWQRCWKRKGTTGCAKSMPSQWPEGLARCTEIRETDMPTAQTAQDERVEVRALKGEYQFGFHDPDQSVFRARKGLDQQIVAQISEIKNEPQCMLADRLRALDISVMKQLRTWDGDVAATDIDHIHRDV